MSSPSAFFVYRPSLVGEPWLPIDDASLLEDHLKYKCELWVMAKRARRTEEEVVARLKFLLKGDPDLVA